MATATIRTFLLPESWFDRPLYGPRLEEGGRSVWFALARAAGRLGELPRSPPAFPEEGRRPLVRAFEETYSRWHLPAGRETEQALAALARPGACAVVAGQQPGFLGGPLFSLYKALTAVALARRLAEAWARPCAAVFWVAGEDHDLEEVRHARFPGAGGAGPPGEEVTFSLPHPPGRRPLSTLGTDQATEAVLDAAVRHFAPRRHGPEAVGLVGLYRGRGVASGFAAILCELLGGHGLLVLNPEELRPLARPFFRRAVEEPAAVLARIEEGSRAVASLGLRPFVAPRLPLFLVRDGERHHLSTAPGGLQIDGGGPEIGRRELLEILERSPERFSAGALLRPVVQQALLPCALTVAGAAELGYFLQLGPLCRSFGVEPPRAALRLQATLLEGKQARLWERLGLDGERLARARRPEDLVPPAEGGGLVEELGALLQRLEGSRDRAEARFRGTPGEKRVRRAARAAAEALGRLRERLRDEEVRGREEPLAAARALWGAIFPGGVLQERRWGAFHYVAKYGRGWIEALLEEVFRDPFTPCHRLVSFELEGAVPERARPEEPGG